MKIVLLGPPGAGKGTQAARIADALGVSRVSSGDLFREHQRNETSLGKLVRSYMDRGVLVPDEVTIKMIMEWINAPDRSRGFVLDGFPRTLGQANALDAELEDRGGIDKVLFINVQKDELVRRLSGRLICSACQTPYNMHSSPPREADKCDRCGGELYQREDDRPDAVTKRIQVYAEETEPLVQYYREAGKLEEIDGEGSIDSVGRELVASVSHVESR